MRKIIIYLKTIILFSACNSLFAQQTQSDLLPHVMDSLNISYGSNDRQKLDIYYLHSKSYPVFIMLHEGMWMYGDKTWDKTFCYHLAKENKVGVVRVNYGLYPNVNYPENVEDVA